MASKNHVHLEFFAPPLPLRPGLSQPPFPPFPQLRGLATLLDGAASRSGCRGGTRGGQWTADQGDVLPDAGTEEITVPVAIWVPRPDRVDRIGPKHGQRVGGWESKTVLLRFHAVDVKVTHLDWNRIFGTI